MQLQRGSAMARARMAPTRAIILFAGLVGNAQCFLSSGPAAPCARLFPRMTSSQYGHSLRPGASGRVTMHRRFCMSSTGILHQAPVKGSSLLLAKKTAAAVAAKPPLVALLAALFSTAGGLPALFAVSLVAEAVGFYRSGWFFTLGYGAAHVLMGLTALYHFGAAGAISKAALVHASLVIAWGVRITGFLAWREFVGWPEWKRRLVSQSGKTPLARKASTWAFVALFDTLLFSPVLFHLMNPTSAPVLANFGVALAWLGLVLESAADNTKAALKAKRPNAFCDVGVYMMCRHPNYLGEILFWTGSFLAGAASFVGPVQWLVALLGLAAIWGVMVRGSAGLDRKQMIKYQVTDGYKAYVESTPPLLPFTAPSDYDALRAELVEELVEEKSKSDTFTVAQQEIKSPYTLNKNPWDV